MKKRVRRQRTVAKPERLSKSLQSVRKLATAHRWLAMVTFKPRETTNVITSNNFQTFLLDLLRRELRGKGIGFMLVREFGTGRSENDSGDRSHFHAVMTAELPEDLETRVKKSFLRRCGLKNNQSRAYDYRTHTRDGEPTFGAYVAKLKKDGIDVINPPEGWDFKKLRRLYQKGFLNSSSLVNNDNLIPY